MKILRGRVKWFNDPKGHGYIEQEDGEEVFVHYTAISQIGFKTLKEGQMVEFEVEQKPWGLQAQNVNLVRGMIETEKSTVSSVTNHSVKEMSQAVEHLKRQIEGMKVKEQEFKRFKSRYQDMLRQNQLLNDTTHHMQREVYKFLRAVVEIANASRDFRRRDMIDYARKVLAGLGYDIKGISYDDGE